MHERRTENVFNLNVTLKIYQRNEVPRMLPAKLSAAEDDQVGHEENHIADPVRPCVIDHKQLDVRFKSEEGHEAAGHCQLHT